VFLNGKPSGGASRKGHLGGGGLLGRLLDKMFGATIPTVKEKAIDDYHTCRAFRISTMASRAKTPGAPSDDKLK
jgi:hypothetical protein